MKIGLISDTHGFLDSSVAGHFASCDEIWHAGDIGEGHVIDRLQAMKSLRAVYGNIDTKEYQHRFPEDLFFQCEELKVFITHIAGTPPNYKPRIKKIITAYRPDILICGHSHILKVGRDATNNNLLFINPGAAGNQGFHHIRTIMRFDIDNKTISDVQVIELGKRGALPTP